MPPPSHGSTDARRHRSSHGAGQSANASAGDASGPDASAPFGFRDVPLAEKQALVDDVFHKVATRYDLMNDLMSFGVHRAWKDALVAMLRPRTARRGDAGGFHALDVAGGTGDVAFRILDAAGTGAQVTVCDINADMLAVGMDRAAARYGAEALEGPAPQLAFRKANAEALPFEDARFDAYTIAFGIRNVPRIDAALVEAHRVLRRGGRFLCLEFSPVQTPLLDRLYDAWSFSAIPTIGRAVTGDAAPYRYLVESIRTFPRPAAFERQIAQAGFGRVSHRLMTGGVVAIHSGWKI